MNTSIQFVSTTRGAHFAIDGEYLCGMKPLKLHQPIVNTVFEPTTAMVERFIGYMEESSACQSCCAKARAMATTTITASSLTLGTETEHYGTVVGIRPSYVTPEGRTVCCYVVQLATGGTLPIAFNADDLVSVR